MMTIEEIHARNAPILEFIDEVYPLRFWNDEIALQLEDVLDEESVHVALWWMLDHGILTFDDKRRFVRP